MIPAGTYTAKATGSFDFGKAAKGTEQVAVEFEILDGPEAGRCLTWFGFFTEATTERTIESLRYAGWQGDDITTLDGLGSRRVSLVVEHESYNGKVIAKVQWVNRFGGMGVVKLKQPMDEKQKRQFAAKMKGFAASVPALPPEDAAVLQRQAANGNGNGASGHAVPADDPPEPGDAEPPPHSDEEIPF